jgi:hypothetical protein
MLGGRATVVQTSPQLIKNGMIHKYSSENGIFGYAESRLNKIIKLKLNPFTRISDPQSLGRKDTKEEIKGEDSGEDDLAVEALTINIHGKDFSLSAKSVKMRNSDISGEIHQNLFLLRLLRKLDLSCNGLINNIPAEIKQLSLLCELDLSSNQLSGEIPNEIGVYLIQLRVLNLSVNKFAGTYFCYTQNYVFNYPNCRLHPRKFRKFA